MKWNQQNMLDVIGTINKTALEQSAELTTEDLAKKIGDTVPCEVGPANYSQIVTGKFRDNYYASFNNDLTSLRSFAANDLRGQINSIIDIIKYKLNEKK